MTPAYLRHQIAQSLKNLQAECIDLYYLHNPESQRAVVGEMEFRARLREAFAALEVAVAQGHIAAYGTATWNGYRAPPHAPEVPPRAPGSSGRPAQPPRARPPPG